MLPHLNYRYATSRSTSFSFTGDISITEGPVATSKDELTVSNGLVLGDKRKPNPFKFNKCLIEGVHYLEATSGYTAGKPVYTSTVGRRITSDPGSMSPLIIPDWGRTSDRAMEKIYDQIRGNSNLVIDFLEGAQTIRMLRSTFSLKNFVKTFIKRNSRKRTTGQGFVDDLSGKWLEYRYGWLPLCGSIYDAMDNLSRMVINLTPTFKGRSGSLNQLKTVTGDGSYSLPRITTISDLSYRTQYGIQLRISPTTSIYDWTSLNPVKIAWELLPFSFVADWVVNVSQQLSLLEDYWLFRSSFLSGWRTDSYKEVSSYFTFGRTSLPVQYWTNGQAQDNSQYEKFRSHAQTRTVSQLDRTILLDLPLPAGLRVNVEIGAKRQLDAAALLWQLVKSTPPPSLKAGAISLRLKQARFI